MGKTDGPAVVEGQDQALAVEVDLAEDELLEQVDRYRLHQPGLPGLASPNVCQGRWIDVAECAISRHRKQELPGIANQRLRGL